MEDVDEPIEHRVALAGLDRDLLDVDRAEVVAREQPALVDAERRARRCLTEREIEVLEREALARRGIALRAEAALEELAGGTRDLGRQEPSRIDRLRDLDLGIRDEGAQPERRRDLDLAGLLAAADQRLGLVDEALLVDEIDAAVDLGERELERRLVRAQREIEVDVLEIEPDPRRRDERTGQRDRAVQVVAADRGLDARAHHRPQVPRIELEVPRAVVRAIEVAVELAGEVDRARLVGLVLGARDQAAIRGLARCELARRRACLKIELERVRDEVVLRPLGWELREAVQLDVDKADVVARDALLWRPAIAARHDARNRHAEGCSRTFVLHANQRLRRGHREPHVELRDQRIGRIHVEERAARISIGAGRVLGVDVHVLEPRGEAKADVVGRHLVGLIRLEVHVEVEVAHVDVAQVEHRRRGVRVDAGAKPGGHARVERGDDRDARLVVRMERVGLAGLLDQCLAAVDPQVAEHEIVVAEQQGVGIDLDRDQRRSHQLLAGLSLTVWIAVGPLVRSAVLVGIPDP